MRVAPLSSTGMVLAGAGWADVPPGESPAGRTSVTLKTRTDGAAPPAGGRLDFRIKNTAGDVFWEELALITYNGEVRVSVPPGYQLQSRNQSVDNVRYWVTWGPVSGEQSAATVVPVALVNVPAVYETVAPGGQDVDRGYVEIVADVDCSLVVLDTVTGFFYWQTDAIPANTPVQLTMPLMGDCDLQVKAIAGTVNVAASWSQDPFITTELAVSSTPPFVLPYPNTRMYLDWNKPVGNWYDDRSTYDRSMSLHSVPTKSAAQQIFGQDTLLLTGNQGVYLLADTAANGHVVSSINDNWYAYVWGYPTSYSSVDTWIAQGPKNGALYDYWRLASWTGFPVQGPIMESSGGVIMPDTNLAGNASRTNDWNLYLVQWDAVERKLYWYHDDGAGTMQLLYTSGVIPENHKVAAPMLVNPNNVKGVFFVGIGHNTAGFVDGFHGHIGPVKMAMGPGMDLWPKANFPTPVVADASP